MERFRQDRSWGNAKSWLVNTNRSGKSPKTDGMHRALVTAAILFSLCYTIAGCASGNQGTYTEPGGNYVLVLKSSGKADLTAANVTTPCTYTQTGSTITLTCEDFDDSIILTLHDDGSLTSPPGSLLPTLRKK